VTRGGFTVQPERMAADARRLTTRRTGGMLRTMAVTLWTTARMDGLRTKFSLRAASVKALGFLTTGVLAALKDMVTRKGLGRLLHVAYAAHFVTVFAVVNLVQGP
jgi:hypothetical protein